MMLTKYDICLPKMILRLTYVIQLLITYITKILTKYNMNDPKFSLVFTVN